MYVDMMPSFYTMADHAGYKQEIDRSCTQSTKLHQLSL